MADEAYYGLSPQSNASLTGLPCSLVHSVRWSPKVVDLFSKSLLEFLRRGVKNEGKLSV